MNVRVRLLNLLLLAALTLAATKLWQLGKEPPPTLPPIVQETTSPQVEPGAGGQPPAPVEARPEDFDVIVARDLFSPTRGVVPPAPVTAVKPASQPPPQPPPKLTLYGIVILDGDKYAYLQEGTQDARPRKIREQETFAGGTLSSIRPDGVTFVFGGNEMTIPLRTPKDSAAGRGAAAGAAARAVAAQPPGAVGAPGGPVRRRGQMPVVPGQMPGQMPGQVPGAPGMPVFPIPAEPVDDGSGEFEIAPDEVFDAVDEEMPLGEEIIQ